MRVLLVEDHAKLAMALAVGLRQAGMSVDVAFDGDDALEHVAVTRYDVVVLDRDIPGVHGDDVCRAIVSDGSTSRVLMLTAAGTVTDRVSGLDIGADDYLPKPCDFSELVARIRALGRRPGIVLPPVLVHGDLKLDPARRTATRNGQLVPLNPKEFAVLEALLKAGGGVVSAEELLERVWDEMADPFTQTVRTTMSRLRAKLGDPPLIETIPKAGYRIDDGRCAPSGRDRPEPLHAGAPHNSTGARRHGPGHHANMTIRTTGNPTEIVADADHHPAENPSGCLGAR